jgi:hypothetical protein
MADTLLGLHGLSFYVGCNCVVATMSQTMFAMGHTPLHAKTCPMATANEKRLYTFIEDEQRRLSQCCSSCGEIPLHGFDSAGRWRFNGLSYEHKCQDPQAGHYPTEPIQDFIGRLKKELEEAKAEGDKDYADMRRFQSKYIEADHLLRKLRDFLKPDAEVNK